MILARCGVAKKRAKLLRTSLYASSLALFLLLARRQNHCAKLLSVTEAFFAFYSKKSVSSLFLLLLSLTNCKIIAPNRLTFPKFFPAFQEKILLLSLLLQIKKSLKKEQNSYVPHCTLRAWLFFCFLPGVKIIAPNY